MLALAGSDADGTLTYSVPPEHTAEARSIVGEGKSVCAEQAVMLEIDPGKARAAAREYMKFYLTLPAYQKNLGALGFNQTDLADGGSDRLVDTIVAWATRPNFEPAWKLITRQAPIMGILPLKAAGGLVPDLRTLVPNVMKRESSSSSADAPDTGPSVLLACSG